MLSPNAAEKLPEATVLFPVAKEANPMFAASQFVPGEIPARNAPWLLSKKKRLSSPEPGRSSSIVEPKTKSSVAVVPGAFEVTLAVVEKLCPCARTLISIVNNSVVLNKWVRESSLIGMVKNFFKKWSPKRRVFKGSF